MVAIFFSKMHKQKHLTEEKKTALHIFPHFEKCFNKTLPSLIGIF